MRKFLSLLLILSMLITPAIAEQAAALTVDAPAEIVNPGRGLLLSYTSPVAGSADIVVTDAAGQIISTVVLDYPTQAGYNAIWWNGTYQGVPVPQGSHQLTVTVGELTASAPITVGGYAPFMRDITFTATEVDPDAVIGITFETSCAGTLNLRVNYKDMCIEDSDTNVDAGLQTINWSGFGLNPGEYSLVLTLTDEAGVSSTQETFALRLIGPEPAEDAGDTVVEQLMVAPTPVPATPVPTATPAPEATSAIVEDVVFRDPAQDVFTPSYGSPYTDTATNFWTTPMDITNEEAVWAALMEPMWVIDGNEKTQIRLRTEPKDDADGVGVVTKGTQGVHVIEHLDNGWSLVECYSSSFHDSKYKAWNMLVQGYVETSSLKQITPSQEYGLVVDKLTQRLYVFKEGKLFSTLLISTGLANERQPYNETRSGEFFLTSAVGEFSSDNLYCSMALRFNDGDLLHEVPHVKLADGGKNYSSTEYKLGTKASHGCIRVQRKRTPEGVNMQWLWDNRNKYTKLLIWEDWQGRQVTIPSDNFQLYYNPNGGAYYHSQETCYSVKRKDVVFSTFTYAQLDEEPYASLEACEYCAPVQRRAVLEEKNALYAPGGDHDPVMTEARLKLLEGK